VFQRGLLFLGIPPRFVQDRQPIGFPNLHEKSVTNSVFHVTLVLAFFGHILSSGPLGELLMDGFSYALVITVIGTKFLLVSHLSCQVRITSLCLWLSQPIIQFMGIPFSFLPYLQCGVGSTAVDEIMRLSLRRTIRHPVFFWCILDGII
jgi:hypothetical protein